MKTIKFFLLFLSIFLMQKNAFSNSSDLVKIINEINTLEKKQLQSMIPKIELEYSKSQTLINAVKIVLLKHNYVLALQNDTIEKIKKAKNSEESAFIQSSKEKIKIIQETYDKIKEISLKITHPVILCYLGSIETIKGSSEEDPSLKMAWVNKGISHIDQALKEADQSDTVLLIILKMIRSSNNLNLPLFFNRLPIALNDLQWINQTASQPNFIPFLKTNGALITFNLAKAYELNGEKEKSKKFYQMCVDKYKGSPYAQLAQKKLKG